MSHDDGRSPYDKLVSKVDGAGTPGSTLPLCIIPGITVVRGTGPIASEYYREPQPPPGYRPVLRLLTMTSRDGPESVYTDATAPRWSAALINPADMLEVAPNLAGSTKAQIVSANNTRASAFPIVRIGAGVTGVVTRDNFGVGFYPPPGKEGRWWGLLATAIGAGATAQHTISVAWEYRRITGEELS